MYEVVFEIRNARFKIHLIYACVGPVDFNHWMVHCRYIRESSGLVFQRDLLGVGASLDMILSHRTLPLSLILSEIAHVHHES